MPVTLTQTDTGSSGTDTSSYTFTNRNLGTASATRQIVVAVMGGRAAAGLTVSSVTIAGVSASQVVASANTTSITMLVALWSAAVPTGTTGDVVVTFSNAVVRASVVVYSMVGASPTAFDTVTSTATDPSGQIDIPAGGAAIAIAVTNANTTTTWTGLTERVDAVIEGTAYSSSSDEFASAQTNLTVTCDWGTNANPSLAVASWSSSIVTASGSTSLTFSTSANLRGKINVAGSTSLSFTAQAVGAAKAKAAAATSLTFTTQGTIRGKGRLQGATGLTFSPSATVKGKARLIGSTSLTFSPTASLRGMARRAGSTSLTFSLSAHAAGKAFIVGSTSLTFTLTGSARLRNARVIGVLPVDGPGQVRVETQRVYLSARESVGNYAFEVPYQRPRLKVASAKGRVKI